MSPWLGPSNDKHTRKLRWPQIHPRAPSNHRVGLSVRFLPHSLTLTVWQSIYAPLFTLIVYYVCVVHSSWSATAQRVGGSDESDDDCRVLVAAARRTLQRPDRLLQVALCGGGPVGQRGHGHDAQPDGHGHWRAEEVDRVQGLGPGWHHSRRRAHLLSDNGANFGRRYVSPCQSPLVTGRWWLATHPLLINPHPQFAPN